MVAKEETTGLRAITFDAGDTLVHLWVHKRERFGYLCSRAGIAIQPEEARNAAARAVERFFQMRHRNSSTNAAEWWHAQNLEGLKAGGIVGDLESVSRNIYDAMKELPETWVVEPDAPSVLSELRARGLKLAVVSNWNGTLSAVLDQLGLAKYFDFVADSQVLGARKPDPEIYRITCQALGVQAAECWHVGDSPEADVAVANAVGARAILYDPLDCLGPFDGQIKQLTELISLVER